MVDDRAVDDAHFLSIWVRHGIPLPCQEWRRAPLFVEASERGSFWEWRGNGTRTAGLPHRLWSEHGERSRSDGKLLALYGELVAATVAVGVPLAGPLQDEMRGGA